MMFYNPLLAASNLQLGFNNFNFNTDQNLIVRNM